MPLPRLPDPRGLPRLAERASGFVDDMVGLVPRAVALLGSAETLLQRARELIDRIEATRAAADETARRTEETRARADRVVDESGLAVARGVALLDAVEPPLTRMLPVLERLAETTTPAEVDALTALVDRLPLLAERVETDVLPVVETLQTVGPDLRELLDIASELNEVLGRVPGMGRIKKRVEDEHATEDAEQAGEDRDG